MERQGVGFLVELHIKKQEDDRAQERNKDKLGLKINSVGRIFLLAVLLLFIIKTKLNLSMYLS